MKRNYSLLAILALALIIRLIFAFGWHETLWDSGVYIGMGKHMYSAGQNGLFEHIRPLFMPFVLGAFWKLGLDSALFGRLFEIILMLGIVWLTYQLAKHWWEEKTAIIASLIVAVSPIFYYLGFHQYTEIPSTFFALLALWLFIKQKHLLAGISAGMSFLAKFPGGMFIAILLIVLILNKKWKPTLNTALGFCIVALPYFFWSWITYGSPLATFLAGQEAVQRVLGCNVLRAKPWWQYFAWLTFSETKLHFLGLLGIFALWKKWKKEHSLFALCLAIPLLYFTQLHCRDYRYLTLFLPFAAMLTALGTIWLYDKFHFKKKWAFVILAILLAAWMTHTSINYYYENEPQQPDIAAEEYFSYLSGKQIQGEIWIANPIIAAHTDQKLEKIYYPVYGTNASQNFEGYLKQNPDKIGAILLDNCGGGLICPPGEPECEQRTQQLIAEIESKFTKVFDKQTGRCWYKVWFTS
jgi:4-amino-4-deoxy-L-arabinose transferase-like glycosyltransferase